MKLTSLFLLLACMQLNANEPTYEITPMIGYTFPNGGQDIRDHTVFAAQLQYNGLQQPINPELSVIYGDVDRNDEGPGDMDVFRTTLSGVYPFQPYRFLTPFIKMGVGYETMSDHLYDNQNGPFVAAGGGIKIPLSTDVAFKIEAIEMQKYHHSQWDNNLLYLAGFSIAFN
jgi:hypothetical protein